MLYLYSSTFFDSQQYASYIPRVHLRKSRMRTLACACCSWIKRIALRGDAQVIPASTQLATSGDWVSVSWSVPAEVFFLSLS